MNFDFSDDQKLLREQAQNFLRDKCPLTRVRKVLDDKDLPYDREIWQGIIELGWPSATIPEDYGGLGLGHLELCVLAEELGYALAPTPFSSSVYLATEAILLFGSEEQKKTWLPPLASGELIGTFALAEGTQSSTAANIKTTFKGGELNGVKYPVPDGDIADFAVVVARAEDGIQLVLADIKSTARKSLKTVDPTRSHAKITFNKTKAEVMTGAGSGMDDVQLLFNRAAVPFAFEQVGGAQASLDMAREYALGRYAFGRPIASFQAIKHKLADMYIAITLARSNSYYGAWALSTDAAELPIAAATARVSATQAFYQASKESIQTHGGMGFTWEFDCHLFYRRSKLLAANLGAEMRWQELLITALEESNRKAA